MSQHDGPSDWCKGRENDGGPKQFAPVSNEKDDDWPHKIKLFLNGERPKMVCQLDRELRISGVPGAGDVLEISEKKKQGSRLRQGWGDAER